MKNTLVFFVSISMLAICSLFGIIVSSQINRFFGIGVFLLLFGPFILQGLRNIPNQPPQKGVLTFLGERTENVLDEGWNFFPFFPYIFGYVGVEVKRISKKIIVTVKTPDRANSEVPIEITYRPINDILIVIDKIKKPLTGLFINFLNNGGNNGVENQLEGKIQERVREWAMADEEGPQDWEELQKSRLEASSVLTKTIGFNHVTEIPSYAQLVPTVILMRYFTNPRPTKWATLNEKDWIGEDGKWKKVEDAILTFSDDENERLAMKNLTDDAVEKRRKEVQKLRSGEGEIFLEDLGIKIERLNVGEIKVLGEVANAADKKAKEKQEMEAEKQEIDNVKDRIKELISEPFNYSKEQALEIVQTERGKVTKTITESKLNISPETRELIKDVVPGATSALLGIFMKRRR